jgi:hypothetical protein
MKHQEVSNIFIRDMYFVMNCYDSGSYTQPAGTQPLRRIVAFVPSLESLNWRLPSLFDHTIDLIGYHSYSSELPLHNVD